MPIRKRVIQIAGISAAAGFAVVTSPGTAHASSMHDTKSDNVSKSDHVNSLELRYGASGGAAAAVSGGSAAAAAGGAAAAAGKGTAVAVASSGGSFKAATSSKKSSSKKDCKPKKKVTPPKVEKPKIEIPKVETIVVEKPKVVVVEKEAPAPAPAPMPVIHIEQSQTQTQTQTEAPKTVVLAAAPAAPVVQSAQLAKTGVETWHLAGLGSGLIGLGVAMEAASRKRRTAGKVEVKGATEIAALGEKFEDKNKLVLPLVDIDANTAAWPVMVQA